MTKTSELLLKLQGVDYQLGELERSKDYLPDMITNLKAGIQAAQQALDDAVDQLEATRLDHKRLELRVQDKRVELENLKAKMTHIKTNKEYDALSQEIDAVKNDISESEDGIIAALEAIERLTAEIEERKTALKEVKTANSTQLDTIRKEMDSVGDKIRIKQGERENILVRLEHSLVSVYERVRKGRGAAVVIVRNRACSGCFKMLPPQLIQEIRRGERVITCDSCGRILIWDQEGPDDQ